MKILSMTYYFDGRVTLAEIDIVCAFHSLCVDPTDTMKVEINLDGKMYIDTGIGMGPQQRGIPESLLRHLIHGKNSVAKICAYIDNYIIVAP